ncbi:MAG: hypothetical protein ACFCUQ_15785 [Kiloniellales bacterium]
MMENSVAVLSEMNVTQAVAFISFAAFTIGFFVWVAWLWLKKH